MRPNLALTLSALLLVSQNASADTVAKNWPQFEDYRVILWMSGQVRQDEKRLPVIFERLREMGVNTAMAGRGEGPKPFLDAGFGYYVENIINKGLCLKFSSSVTNWSKHIDEWMKTRDESAFVRDYSFDDTLWRESVFDTMLKAAKFHAPFNPVAFDLRDELSVTISANPFDYDFSPTALVGFREWLKGEYGTLERLNEQWDTDFPSWEVVRPFTTDQIKARMVTGERMPKGPPDWNALKSVKFDPAQAARHSVRWNFSPWCDHRTYMDISLARTLDDLRAESRKHAPGVPVGIEGTQMPSAFGGYDLWRLSQAVDWMEPYDIGNAREILGSFMPGKPLLSTVFEKETNAAQRRLWHLLLLGDRGCIIWWSEDVIDWSKPDLPLSAKGKALAPVLKQMTSPLAKLFLRAEKEYDPIAIHYSQPSIQVAWLLETVADGKTWPRRFSSYEATHNRHAKVRGGWMKFIQDMGYTPKFVASEQVELGALDKKMKHEVPWIISSDRVIANKTIESNAYQVLVFPRSWGLSDSEAGTIKKWLSNPGGFLVQDSPSDYFNHRGRLRQRSENSIDDISGEKVNNVILFDGSSAINTFLLKQFGASMEHYLPMRLQATFDVSFLEYLIGKLEDFGVYREIRTPPSARVLTHRYKLGAHRLLAFERNIEWRMSEDLAQAGGNQELEKPVTFTAEWDEPAEVVDLWTGQRLGKTNKIKVNLDPWKPAPYALLNTQIEGDVIDGLLREAAK
jgi:hypothetical protein